MSLNSTKFEPDDTNLSVFTAREKYQFISRIRVRIPKEYHQEPVISRLASNYGLEVNIRGAILGQNAREDGWFDLLLKGTPQQIDSAMIYLSDLDIEVWQDLKVEVDGW
ncbi:NIL domain-containing protein [Planktothrix mougeotii]|uniref:NIL domain-containing protein n=1 Tax=Planktothrix mougeotii LEGE 06226 TaxID=1828728 RepID=A0ABR9U569_9CYAN|nr:NIL domain-containing protein [Planktothrix mougeotii]MBE9141607.1 NIL domain-containing protein [Planktothrix mougeotii LEGE 06226]